MSQQASDRQRLGRRVLEECLVQLATQQRSEVACGCIEGLCGHILHFCMYFKFLPGA